MKKLKKSDLFNKNSLIAAIRITFCLEIKNKIPEREHAG